MKNKTTTVLVLLAVALIAFLGGFALRDFTTTKQTSANKSTSDNTNSIEETTTTTTNHTLQEALKIVESYSRVFVNAKSLSELSKEDLQTLIFNKTFERKNETISLEDYEKEIKNSPFNTITFEPTDI
jgi:ribosome-binding protein aMBF1 (putative translation factor)